MEAGKEGEKNGYRGQYGRRERDRKPHDIMPDFCFFSRSEIKMKCLIRRSNQPNDQEVYFCQLIFFFWGNTSLRTTVIESLYTVMSVGMSPYFKHHRSRYSKLPRFLEKWCIEDNGLSRSWSVCKGERGSSRLKKSSLVIYVFPARCQISKKWYSSSRLLSSDDLLPLGPADYSQTLQLQSKDAYAHTSS